MSWVVPFFLVIAILYSSVGFGGGSGYLAILSATGMDHEKMRFIALCCNILVVSLSTIVFLKKRIFKPKKIIPLIILSVPLALLGGWISIPAKPFFILLGITLLAAGVLMILQLPLFGSRFSGERKTNWSGTRVGNTFMGGLVGLISGLVGIGGGIFLAPILHLSHWGKSATIAAAASLFILVNSLAGLTGQILNHGVPVTLDEFSFLLGAVLFGSIIGTALTLKWIRTDWIRTFTAILVILAAVRILILQIG